MPQLRHGAALATMIVMSTLPADATAVPAPTQFSLRTILLLTAAVAALFAARPWLEFVEFALVATLLVALANQLGLCGLIQGRYTAQSALYLATVTWATSMFFNWLSGAIVDLKGWEVEWLVVSHFFANLDDDPFPHFVLQLTVRVLFVIVSLAMIICPFWAHRLAAGKAHWLRSVLTFIAIVPWCPLCMPPDMNELGLGGYLWVISISIPLLVLPISRPQLAVMFAAGGSLTVWAKFFAPPAH